MSDDGSPPTPPPREVIIGKVDAYPPLTPTTVSTVGTVGTGSWATALQMPRRKLEGQLMTEPTPSVVSSSPPPFSRPPRPPDYAAAAAANPAAAASVDQGAKLAKNLHRCTTERDRVQKQVDQEAAQLRHIIRQAPQRPKESRSALEQRLATIEENRSSCSLSLKMEKALVRQISSVDKSMRLHDKADKYQKTIAKKKAEVELARENLRALNEEVSGMESSLTKVELAKKLGCLPEQVISRRIDCPMDKLAYARGVDGANIRGIEESTGAQIKMDTLRGRIEVQGTASTVQAAVLQLEVYTKAIDKEVTVTPDAMAYLLRQQSSLVGTIRSDNPEVVIDVLSGVNQIKLRGLPDRVQKAKEAIEGVQVVSKSHPLVGRQPALVVGRVGSTMNSFSERHSVVMTVSHDGNYQSVLRIIGPSENVDAALVEVDKLLYDHEQVVETFVVDHILKSELLAKSGVGIRVFQSSLSEAVAAAQPEAGGVLLEFDRSTSKDQSPRLSLKCSRCVMERAKSLAAKKLGEFESNTVSVEVPEEMIPVIIGRGGAGIKELRQEGNGATIKVDAGTIKVYSNDSATREGVRKRIEQTVAENQVGSVPIEKAAVPVILGKSGDDVREACAEVGCSMAVSKDDTQLGLKGTDEQIQEASELIKNFLEKNHIEERAISLDEEPPLLGGGSESNILQKVEKEHGVVASYTRSSYKLRIRGEAANVQGAMEAVNSFLNGGDDMAVCKLRVPEFAIGAVIGRGGSNLSKLQDEFKGVLVNIQKDKNLILLRGPQDLVQQCQRRLSITIATARVSKSIQISQKQLRQRGTSEAIKRISRSTGVELTMNGSSIAVRGTSHDVRDATSNINELLSGTYNGYIDLSSEQFSCADSAITNDSSHFERIRDSTGADIVLEAAETVIHISGPKSSVKKAKLSVIELLESLLPQQLEAVELHRSLFKSVGDPQRLAEIAAQTGASVVLDRDLHCILVNSDDLSNVPQAATLLKELVAEKQKLNAVMCFDASESWLLRSVVGPRGSTLNKISRESGCTIEVIEEDITVVVSAETETAVQAGKEAVQEVVDQARKETVFVNIPEPSIGAFIGRGGQGIKQLAADHDVNAFIETTEGCPARVRIKGKEECVARARYAVLSWVQQWEESQAGIDLEVTKAMIPVLLGRDGSFAIEDTGCRIRVDRTRSVVTVLGGSDYDRGLALERIKEIIGADEQASSCESSSLADLGKVVELKRQMSEITAEESTSVVSEPQGEQGCTPLAIGPEDEEQQLYQELPASQDGDDLSSDLAFNATELFQERTAERDNSSMPPSGKLNVSDRTAATSGMSESDRMGRRPQDDLSSELGSNVSQLLQERIDERDSTQRLIDQERARLHSLSKLTPKRPKETSNVDLSDCTARALIHQFGATQESIELHDQAEEREENKADITSMQEELRPLDEVISDIESVMSKAELAKRLGCSPWELVSREVDFPASQLRRVLGDGGANIARVEESTRVRVTVDECKGALKVSGSELAVNEAVALLEVYTMIADEQVRVSHEVVSYLLARQSSALNAIRDDHPEVEIGVCNLSSITLRGHPERVKKAKSAIRDIQVVSKARVLVDSEATLVVGRATTPDIRFGERHSVVVHLSPARNKSTLRIAGPSERVDEAWAEVDRLLLHSDASD
ncbi:hypothetical protein ACHAXT_006281 [Thalassiosira profunda]